MSIKEQAFDKLIGSFPKSFDGGQMRQTYLKAWQELPDSVVSRTVDHFVKNSDKCPSLSEFMGKAKSEGSSQRRINRAQSLANCKKCYSGFIEVDVEKDTWKPCDTCLPDTFQQWRDGEYEKSW